MGRDCSGFTSIELVTVMAIVSIGLALGLPGFLEATQKTRVSTTVNLLSSDMAMARSSAVMRQSRVVVCPRAADHEQCRSDEDWSSGWIVFTDADGNRQPDAPDHLLRVTDPPGSATLALPASRSLLIFLPDGRAAGSNLTINICAGNQVEAQVVVNNLGRVRSVRDTTASTCPRA